MKHRNMSTYVIVCSGDAYPLFYDHVIDGDFDAEAAGISVCTLSDLKREMPSIGDAYLSRVLVEMVNASILSGTNGVLFVTAPLAVLGNNFNLVGVFAAVADHMPPGHRLLVCREADTGDMAIAQFSRRYDDETGRYVVKRV